MRSAPGEDERARTCPGSDLASRNIKAIIPGRSNRRVKIDHDRELYKQRNCIERMFGRLKINRSIATRGASARTRSPLRYVSRMFGLHLPIINRLVRTVTGTGLAMRARPS